MLQQRRWATDLLEILFTKQNPLNGSSCKKIRFRQSLAYLYIFTWGLRSIPELFYCLLPAYCVLHGSALFPKVNLYLYMYVLLLMKLILNGLIYFFVAVGSLYRYSRHTCGNALPLHFMGIYEPWVFRTFMVCLPIVLEN